MKSVLFFVSTIARKSVKQFLIVPIPFYLILQLHVSRYDRKTEPRGRFQHNPARDCSRSLCIQQIHRDAQNDEQANVFLWAEDIAR